jgi:hypothetical protein
MARGGPDGGCGGGGAGIQAPSARRARIASGVVAVLAAAAFAAYPAAQDIDLQPLAFALGTVALVLLAAGLTIRSSGTLGWSLAALLAEYAVLFRAEGRSLDELTPVYAAGLLLVAELAFWTIEPRVSTWADPGLLERRLAFLVSACAGAAFVAALVLVIAAAGGGGVAVDAAGAAAAVGILALTALLVRGLVRTR